MKVRLTAQAEAELHEAIAYLNEQAPGLGARLAAEVDRALDRILQYPNAYPLAGRRMRRILVHRFSYGLYYFVGAEEIIVAAVAHLKRRPGYWRGRLSGDEL